MTPEEEAAALETDLRAAEASGDITAMLSLLAQTAQMTVEDYVQKTVGNVMYLYYAHIDMYHIPPRDMDDLVDGMLYVLAKGYIRQRTMQEVEAQAKRNKRRGL